MALRMVLVAWIFLFIQGCGLFIQDDFPEYLLYAEDSYNIKSYLEENGLNNPNHYEVVRAWMPRAKYGYNLIFVIIKLEIAGNFTYFYYVTDYKDFKPMALYGAEPNANTTAYLSEVTNGWRTGDLSIYTNTGTIITTSNEIPLISKISRSINIGSLYWDMSTPTLSGYPSTNLLISSIGWNADNSYNSTADLSYTLPISTNEPHSGFFDLQSNSQDHFYILTKISDKGLVLGFENIAQFDTNNPHISYSGFPIVDDDERGHTYLTSDGPIVFKDRILTRYLPKNGSNVADQLRLPDGFHPLSFSFEEKKWIGFDESSGEIYLLRSWW